jgi:hypothetical protein
MSSLEETPTHNTFPHISSVQYILQYRRRCYVGWAQLPPPPTPLWVAFPLGTVPVELLWRRWKEHVENTARKLHELPLKGIVQRKLWWVEIGIK